MRPARLSSVVLSVLLPSIVLVSACTPRGDLHRLRVDVASSGWTGAGHTAESRRFVPAAAITLHNDGTAPLEGVDVFLSFWPVGADGEKDAQPIAGIAKTTIEPGASLGPFVLRSAAGYNLAGVNADLFTHSQFKDWLVKVYARRGGQVVPLGEFSIARRFVTGEGGPTLAYETPPLSFTCAGSSSYPAPGPAVSPICRSVLPS